MERNFSIFSDDTLDSLAMAEIMGGGEDPTVNNCYGGNCGNCVSGCGSNTGVCGDINTNVSIICGCNPPV